MELNTRPGLLEAWLALTSIKYHGNLQVLIPTVSADQASNNRPLIVAKQNNKDDHLRAVFPLQEVKQVMVPKPQIIGKHEMHYPASFSLLYFLPFPLALLRCFSLDNSQLFFNLHEQTRNLIYLLNFKSTLALSCLLPPWTLNLSLPDPILLPYQEPNCCKTQINT